MRAWAIVGQSFRDESVLFSGFHSAITTAVAIVARASGVDLPASVLCGVEPLLPLSHTDVQVVLQDFDGRARTAEWEEVNAMQAAATTVDRARFRADHPVLFLGEQGEYYSHNLIMDDEDVIELTGPQRAVERDLRYTGAPIEWITIGSEQSVRQHWRGQVRLHVNMVQECIYVDVFRYVVALDSHEHREFKDAVVAQAAVSASEQDLLGRFVISELQKFQVSRIVRMKLPFEYIESIQHLTHSEHGTLLSLKLSKRPLFFTRRVCTLERQPCHWRQRTDWTPGHVASQFNTFTFFARSLDDGSSRNLLTACASIIATDSHLKLLLDTAPTAFDITALTSVFEKSVEEEEADELDGYAATDEEDDEEDYEDDTSLPDRGVLAPRQTWDSDDDQDDAHSTASDDGYRKRQLTPLVYSTLGLHEGIAAFDRSDSETDIVSW